MRYQKRRSYAWSTPIAYSVGLMASDGCLQSDGRHLDLTSVDLEQLRNFNKSLGRDIKIGLKQNSSSTPAYRVQFSDVAYYDFLISIGLTPRKSKSINKLEIPDYFYAHFLRGLFDGDGSSYAYHDPRWPTSYLYYTALSSGSLDFLHYISDTNKRLIGVKGNSIRQSARAFSLVYAKADSYLLYRFLYRASGGLHLTRKKAKLESFIRYDENVIIT